MELTAAQLDGALAAGLRRTRWRLRNRTAIWLSRPDVTIAVTVDGATTLIGRWEARRHDGVRGHGYSRRQARQIRRALRAVAPHRQDDLETMVLAHMYDWPAQ